MRKIIIGCALLICVATPANAQGPASKWATVFLARIVPEHASIARLYAGRETIIAQYTVAMRRYKAAGERSIGERMAISFQPSDCLPMLEPFTWIAASGDMVRRVGDGTFVLSAGNQLGNWYQDISCQVTLWPTLFCSDFRERTMSAPDLETVIFDGVEFKRPYPVVQELPDEADLLEGVLPDQQN